MRGLNVVHLIGNLGADPEMRITPAGKSVTSLRMATSRKYTNGQGDLVEDTCWHRVICWDKLAESCNKSLSKGNPVYVQGRITNRSWEDDAGQKRYTSEIIAREVIFLGKPLAYTEEPFPDEEAGGFEQASVEKGAEIEPDDIPF